MTANLTSHEAQELDHLEGIITGGLERFVEVGSALLQIKKRKLYQFRYSTFEDYCRERWNISRAHAYRLIDADKVGTVYKDVNSLSPMGDKNTPSLHSQVTKRHLTERRARTINAEARGKPEAIRRILERMKAHEAQAKHDRGIVEKPKRSRLKVIERHHRQILKELAADKKGEIDVAMTDYLRRTSEDALARLSSLAT